MLRFFLFFLILLPYPLLKGQDLQQLMETNFTEGVTVDLREPLYVDGVLTTEKGGVITGPNLRIQALEMCYTRKMIDGKPLQQVEAKGDLIVEFGEYLFVGQRLIYDFQSKEGVIFEGRTSVEPWFFGGDRIELRSNGDYVIYNGYVTTSENIHPEWQIQAKEVLVLQENYLSATDIQVKINRFPILWIPSIKANLDSIFNSPFKYRFRWGGKQGPRIGITYEIISGERWKIFLRFDYRITRGPGGGIEFYYNSEDGHKSFESVNYVAKDSSIFDLHEKWRYRFEGVYRSLSKDDKTNILLTYEKVSDIALPSSYYDKDFDLEPSKRTQLRVRHQEKNWIGEFYSRVRVNNFQTVKQELPTITLNLRPSLLGFTGIIAENWTNLSYLDFKYSHHLPHVHNYSATRLEYKPRFYRPFAIGPLTITPEIGGVSIFYGNSPQHDSQWLALGFFGLHAKTQVFRCYDNVKHVLEPYAHYQYYTYPTSTPDKHFIFDIDDGWYRLNQLTVGVKNAVYLKKELGLSRVFSFDLYAHAFFDAHTFRAAVPKLYGYITFFSLPTVRHTIDTAWDFEHGELDHFNIHSEWTLSTNLAISAELRHRDAFSWRKVNQDNFFLELFREEKQLRHSPLSDRRDTFLLHLFYRFHPNWSLEISSRQGWNRLTEPSYTEYEIDLLTTIQTAWHLRFSFQHRENDNRAAVYVNVGVKRPNRDCKTQPTVYCYE